MNNTLHNIHMMLIIINKEYTGNDKDFIFAKSKIPYVQEVFHILIYYLNRTKTSWTYSIPCISKWHIFFLQPNFIK